MLNEPVKAKEVKIKTFVFTQGEEGDSVNNWLSNQPDDIRILDIIFQTISSQRYNICSTAILYSKLPLKKEATVRSFKLYKG